MSGYLTFLALALSHARNQEMKAFITWSGELSKQVAELFHQWLPCVLQNLEPWISTEDIEKGSIWFNEIHSELKDVCVGIICLTADNLHNDWILYEAGALAKGLTKNRVCTFLINLKPRDLQKPLSEFNATVQNKEDVFKLLKSINARLGDLGRPDELLRRIFDKFYPEFESRFESIVKDFMPQKPVRRDDTEILEEVLENTRQIMRQMESRTLTFADLGKALLENGPRGGAGQEAMGLLNWILRSAVMKSPQTETLAIHQQSGFDKSPPAPRPMQGFDKSPPASRPVPRQKPEPPPNPSPS